MWVLFWALVVLFQGVLSATVINKEEVVLVHVLFRHGDRTPNGYEELYPNDPYLNKTYFPFGLGQLTNAGKRKEYAIGTALRNRYNNFLGPYYYPNLVEATSTNYNRTKMSVLLVLASLFPPQGVEKWKIFQGWQPIPYNYLPVPEDKVLLGSVCPNFVRLYNEYASTPKIRSEISKDQDVLSYLTQHTGKNITSYQDVYNLFFGLKAEEDYGLTLPEWTRKVWPKNITQLAINEYYLETGTTELRKIASGYFLQKIVNDTRNKISGSTPDKKLNLYSAHENNIADVLLTLDVFGKPHVPNYGSYIVFEVVKISGKYGIKIYYENYVERNPVLLKLPGCDSFCEIDKFADLIGEYMPEGDLCN